MEDSAWKLRTTLPRMWLPTGHPPFFRSSIPGPAVTHSFALLDSNHSIGSVSRGNPSRYFAPRRSDFSFPAVVGVQTWIFYHAFPKDYRLVKLLVASICLFNLLHEVFISYAVYEATVTHYAHAEYLSVITWNFMKAIILSDAIPKFFAQLFYLNRIRTLSKRRTLPALPLLTLATFDAGGCVLITILVVKLSDREHDVLQGIVAVVHLIILIVLRNTGISVVFYLQSISVLGALNSRSLSRHGSPLTRGVELVSPMDPDNSSIPEWKNYAEEERRPLNTDV
ncbi:hypothetical protein FISHEDRAFT_61799 [Fistulina hepatica ATCC 64428]|uniref:Uncharacterized protein n=1 Tax=Fistulina hepatica ATCC 64428 TaxID=1128425 RepID=A0A0D7A3M5_9AGAR|nr:hypothetical protein FISHEDRAFT_61799 [Fistulina hepatica ATCC 64428]